MSPPNTEFEQEKSIYLLSNIKTRYRKEYFSIRYRDIGFGNKKQFTKLEAKNVIFGTFHPGL
jgi:hypothetical protein